MSAGLIGVPSICTIRTLVPSGAGAQGVTHSGESARSAHGFLIKPPSTGTRAATPSAPPAASSEPFSMPRRLMPALSPVSSTCAASVCRSTSSDMPTCRCWMATSCGMIFFANETTPRPNNRMVAPRVSPISGVYSAYTHCRSEYAGSYSAGQKMNTRMKIRPNSAASRNHIATCRSARLSAGEPGM